MRRGCSFLLLMLLLLPVLAQDELLLGGGQVVRFSQPEPGWRAERTAVCA